MILEILEKLWVSEKCTFLNYIEFSQAKFYLSWYNINKHFTPKV